MSSPSPVPERLPFPVLGIPPAVWPGVRRLAMHGGARTRGGGTEVLSVVHSYYLPGRSHPAVVIAQAPLYPGRGLVSGAPSAALSQLLRRRPGRPVTDAPVATEQVHVEIEGRPFTAVRLEWADPRIAHLLFEWRERRRVEIVSWEYGLDPGFVQSPAEIDQAMARVM